MNKYQPIELLTAAEGSVYIASKDPQDDERYIIETGHRSDDGNILTSRGNPVVDAVAWRKAADEVSEIAAAEEQGRSLYNPLTRDPDITVFNHFSRQVAFELADAIGPERAIKKLHDKYFSETAPTQLPYHLAMVSVVLDDWSRDTLSADEAIDFIRAEFQKSSFQN